MLLCASRYVAAKHSRKRGGCPLQSSGCSFSAAGSAWRCRSRSDSAHAVVCLTRSATCGDIQRPCVPRTPAGASFRQGLPGGWRSGRSQCAPCRHEPPHSRARCTPERDRLQWLTPLASGSASCGHHLHQLCHSLRRAAAGG